MVKVVCKQCRGEFEVYPYVIRRGGGKFCSRKCAGLFRRKRITRTCVLCGKEFEGKPCENQGKRVFCSKACFYQWKKRHNAIHTCLWCDRKFVVVSSQVKTGRGKFCSRKCLWQWFARNLSGENSPLYQREIKTCKQCGKKFRAILSADRKFCSRKCQGKWQGQNRVGEQAANWRGGGVELTCKRCDEKFRVKKGRAKTAKFCSRECMWKYKRASRVCKWCGTEFIVPRSRIERKDYFVGFCSKECYWQWQVGNTAGEDSSQWRGGISFEPYGIEFNDALKQTIRSRDGHRCAICKLPEKGKKLSIHHIDYCKTNNDSSNLIAMCNKCHIVTNFHRNYWIRVLAPLPTLHSQSTFGVGSRCQP